ncbi:FAD:protein FMN transferase [Chitinophaga polysaccharea]|uniref:FAD:protein FMN transferase n=1 Tax=Chitinophaga polysaccharea TaxID=1293035 RepID=UPI00115BA192|nr:FAD:protein FMN transferase [Chitinophaga polysaccharea]
MYAVYFLLLLHISVAPSMIHLEGSAQGTTWHIQYEDAQQRDFTSQITHILQDIDQCLSVYRKDSEISLFNNSLSIEFQLPYFYPVLKKSAEVYSATNGAFDPTVMPLSAAYRQGKRTHTPWWEKADSLLQYVGFSRIRFDETGVSKLKEGVSLDFDGIAQGYTVDVLAALLDSNGISNYMVEVGGEVRCKGLKNGAPWTIGIDNPLYPSVKLATVQLHNMAATTAGNYRDHYALNGAVSGHIIHPKTGYSTPDSLLSVTVFSADAITADGYDTAFMVMGVAGTKEFLQQRKDLDAYLVYIGADGEVKVWMTEGVRELIK